MFWHAEENLHHFRIELAARPPFDLLAGRGQGLRRTVRTVGGYGVERIGDRENACAQRNLFAFQAARIAGSVVLFLMGVDDLGSFREKWNLLRIW